MNLFTKRIVLLASLGFLGTMDYSPHALATNLVNKTPLKSGENHSFYPLKKEITVRGIVISDEDNMPLPGVTVLIKGTTRGVSTDVDGTFSIAIPDEGAVLVFSFIGFATQELEVFTDKELSVTLKPELTSMNEVVVVGYGTTRKGDITSSIAGVKEENFVKGAVRDAGQLIQGKVAGLRVTTPSGDPGAGTQINLRGINSINGTSDPLVLIDGIPGSLNTVPPEDIESIDVLKDGSAAAIYGTRATGGVILITTRKGGQGDRNTISYDSYVSVQQIARKLNLLDGDDYRRLIADEGIPYTDYGGNTDWVDEMTRSPISHNHNLSFTGGNRTTNFTASVNYRNWQGIFLRSNQERFNIRADLNHSMFDDKMRANFQIINRVFTSDQGGADGYAYRQAIIRNPTDHVKTENGEWQERDGYFYENPISRIYEADSESKTKEMRVNGSLTYTPVENLDLKMMVSNVQNSNLTGYSTTFNHTNTRLNNQNATASRSTSAYTENLMELTANYNHTIGDHYFTVLGGYSWQDATYEDFFASNWDFPSDLYKWNNLGAGGALQAGQADMGSSKNRWQLAGFFGRATYNFKDKYLFMASVRREGSSRFGINNQWGTFPAASVGWKISNEPFLRDLKNVGEIKLRLGYGVTGTIANSPYLSQISYDFTRTDGAYIGGQWVQGFVPARNFNPDLKWEKKQEINFGIDYSFFSDRLSGSIDIYRRDIKDLLYDFPVPVPPYLTGLMTINAGVLQNDGIEILVNVAPIVKPNFSWNTNVTYSTNRNKLVSLSNDQFEATSDFFTAGYTGEPIQDYTHRVEVGGAIGRFYLWKTVGVTPDGEWLIENTEGEAIPISTASQEDRQFYGNGIPLHILGFNNSFQIRNFDVQLNFRGAFGHEILNFQRMFYENPYNPSYNMLETAYDPVYGQRLKSDLALVSHYIEKGDYFKLDNFTVGYTFPKVAFLRNARMYASGLNLFTITNYTGIDPEGISITGFDPGNDQRDKYPTTRTYTLGINLTF